VKLSIGNLSVLLKLLLLLLQYGNNYYKWLFIFITNCVIMVLIYKSQYLNLLITFMLLIINCIYKYNNRI